MSLLKVTNTSEAPRLVNGSLSLVQREYLIHGPGACSVHTISSIYAMLSRLLEVCRSHQVQTRFALRIFQGLFSSA